MFTLVGLALAADPALPLWRTQTVVVSISAPYDWYRDSQGCLVGFPTAAGDSLRRCESRRYPTVWDATTFRPPNREERGLRLLGQWREATVAELVPEPSKAPYFASKRVDVHVALRDQPEIVSFEYHRDKGPDHAPPSGWWLDWRPPSDLDGTSVVIGHAVAPPPALLPEGLPATRLAAVLPVVLKGPDIYRGTLAWEHEVPLDLLRGGYLTRRDFPELGIAVQLSVSNAYVTATPVDLLRTCPPTGRVYQRPWWKPKPKLQRCNSTSTTFEMRLPLSQEGDRAAMASTYTSAEHAFGGAVLWRTRGGRRESLDIGLNDPYASDLAFSGRDPIFQMFLPWPRPPTYSHVRSAHPSIALRLPLQATTDAEGTTLTLGPRRWSVDLPLSTMDGIRLDVALFGGASPPRTGMAPDAVLAADLDPASALADPWTMPAGLPRPARWMQLRWSRGAEVVAIETIPIEPPAPKRRAKGRSCSDIVFPGAVYANRDAICPSLDDLARTGRPVHPVHPGPRHPHRD